MATHPSWWFDKLTTPPIEFASLRGFSGNSAEVADQIFDPGLTFEDIAWLRKVWPHKLLVKGIQSVADAERVVELGCDGVVLSNHGGHQLDRSPTVLRILPAVRERLGSDPVVLIDSGVMSGSDILAPWPGRRRGDGRPGIPVRPDGRRGTQGCPAPWRSSAASTSGPCSCWG